MQAAEPIYEPRVGQECMVPYSFGMCTGKVIAVHKVDLKSKHWPVFGIVDVEVDSPDGKYVETFEWRPLLTDARITKIQADCLRKIEQLFATKPDAPAEVKP